MQDQCCHLESSKSNHIVSFHLEHPSNLALCQPSPLALLNRRTTQDALAKLQFFTICPCLRPGREKAWHSTLSSHWLITLHLFYVYVLCRHWACLCQKAMRSNWGMGSKHHLPCILGGSEKDLSLLLHHAMRHKVLCQRFCCPGSDFFLDKLLSFPFLPVWTGLTWLGQTKKCHCSCQGHCNNNMSFSRVTRSKRGQSGSVPLTVYGNGNSSKCTSLQPENEMQLLKSLLLLHLKHKSSALHTA